MIKYLKLLLTGILWSIARSRSNIYHYAGLASLQERKLWGSVDDLEGLGELTAQWLEGRVASQPSYTPNAGPDPETLPLVPILAAANRSGFVTDGSQPGVKETRGYDGCIWQQRAAVEGWCDRQTLQDLRELVAMTPDIEIVFGRPHRGRRYRYGNAITVTRRRERHYGWQKVTVFGSSRPRSAIGDMHYDMCNDTLLERLEQTWCVTLVDMQWGREQALWDVLQRYVDRVSVRNSGTVYEAPETTQGRHRMRELVSA